jgi:hypothetical protein
LDELVLLERLGDVFVHLGLDALLSVANHGVGCEGNDGRTADNVVALPFADVGCGFKTTLERL